MLTKKFSPVKRLSFQCQLKLKSGLKYLLIKVQKWTFKRFLKLGI
jgi:hypothetical protein